MLDDDEFYIKCLNTCNLTFVSPSLPLPGPALPSLASGFDMQQRVFLLI